jgi:uncharacterized protein (DUF2336 family)
MSLRAETFASGRRAPAVLDALLEKLVMDVSPEARARLSARLAGSRWAPASLVRLLASDEAAIAVPVLLRSPHLHDHDLMKVFEEGSLDHQSAIARRANLSAPLVEAVLQTHEPALLTALASNDRAEISADALRRLVEASRQHAALRTPLARHPRLTAELAQLLSGWGSEPLKHLLAARFRLHPQAAVELTEDAEQEERVIDKLQKAGQLRLGYLLEALRDGRLALFVAALARMGGFTAAEIRAAVDSDKPELLALACASVGIDQRVFPTVLTGVRALNDGRPGGGEEGERRASGAFAPFGEGVAARAFRSMGGGLTSAGL